MPPKKSLGQHFLTDRRYAQKIVDLIPPCAHDCRVVEIGAGRGALTRFLIQRYPDLHIVEKDPDLIRKCKELLGTGSYTIECSDATAYDFTDTGTTLHVVGNLPYNVASSIIHNVLLHGNRILSCTFMVQREVAQRICAQPAHSDFSYFSVFCRFFGTPRMRFTLPPGAFFPPPNVSSAVFQLQVAPDLNSKLATHEWKDFFAFVKKGFSARRKKLVNTIALPPSFKPQIAQQLVNIVGNDTCRPQELDTDQWLSLYRWWKTM